MLTRRHVLPPSLRVGMARHRLVQNPRSRPNSKTASLYPECNQICAVHAPSAYRTDSTNFHVNRWAGGPCKLKGLSKMSAFYAIHGISPGAYLQAQRRLVLKWSV